MEERVRGEQVQKREQRYQSELYGSEYYGTISLLKRSIQYKEDVRNP